jgi:hypothetical protein
VEPEKVILIYLTVPALVFIMFLIMVELKIFHMAVVIVIAAIVALFEKLDKKYDKAIEEIK